MVFIYIPVMAASNKADTFSTREARNFSVLDGLKAGKASGSVIKETFAPNDAEIPALKDLKQQKTVETAQSLQEKTGLETALDSFYEKAASLGNKIETATKNATQYNGLGSTQKEEKGLHSINEKKVSEDIQTMPIRNDSKQTEPIIGLEQQPEAEIGLDSDPHKSTQEEKTLDPYPKDAAYFRAHQKRQKPTKDSAVITRTVFKSDENAKLFWSYYQPSSVNRVSVGQGSYDRHSPGAWQGDINVNRADNILLLGEFQGLSKGPRKRREVEEDKERKIAGRNLLYPFYSPELQNYQHYQFPYTSAQNYHHPWPYKFTQGHETTSTVTSSGSPSRPPVSLPPTDPARGTVLCRYHCSQDGQAVSCCGGSNHASALVPAFPPFVQPHLLDNWMTEVFEFGAQHPYLYTAGKTVVGVVVVGLIVLFWAHLGELLGMAEIPRARLVLSLFQVLFNM